MVSKMIISSPFTFCEYCKVSQKCCRVLKVKGTLSPPLLTTHDKERLVNHLGEGICDFIQYEYDCKSSKHLMFLRTHARGGCLFYRNNKCQIYDVRPLDCRIFPLDILEAGGHFYWIIYDTFCRQEIECERLVNYGEELIQNYNPDMEEFAVRMNVSAPLTSFKNLGRIGITFKNGKSELPKKLGDFQS